MGHSEGRGTAQRSEAAKVSGTYEPTPDDEALFCELRELRTSLAREQQVPPYFIFSNATLQDVCRRRPANNEELLEVAGVGAKKAERYGELILAKIAAHAPAEHS